MVPSRRRSPLRGRPPHQKKAPATPSFTEQAIRHEARRALNAHVNLASILLRKNPHVSTTELARALDVSPKVAASVRHAFNVRKQMQIDRILERFRTNQPLNVADIMRDLAVDRETAEWLGRKVADHILALEKRHAKKKK